MPNIKNRTIVAQNLWDWDFLNDCWTGNIKPTDIDGVVEKNGHFLFLEGKSLGKNLTKGQEILFKMLTKEFTKSQALILYGKPGWPEEYQIIHGGIISPRKKCDRERIKTICKAWFNAVVEK